MAVDINAGELNQPIRILRRVATQDAAGYEESVRDELVLNCKAKVNRTSGTELVRANADFGEEKVRFLVRYPWTEIDRKMFVRWQGREYPIEYINDYAGREYLEIWTVRRSKEAE